MKTIYAKDYGILPDSGQDSTKLFAAMLLENPSDTMFVLEHGTYVFSSDEANLGEYYFSNTDVDSPRYLSILLKNVRQITLDGQGSRFVYQGQTTPIAIDESEGVVIKNITIDWDIPLSAEGHIVGATQEWVDIAIDSEKYPHFIRDNKIWFKGENWEGPYHGFCEFDGVTKKVAYRTGDAFRTNAQEQLENGRIRFHGQFNPIPKVGNFGVVRHNRRLHPGIFACDSKDIVIENVIIHQTGGLGILMQFCEELTFNGVRFEPNVEAGRRALCGHDDGLHLANNKGKITVENCWFYGLMDDPMNIHGTSVKILEKMDKHTLKGRFVHHQAVGFKTWAGRGDEISFIDHLSMSSCGIAQVKSFELLTPEEFILQFDSEIPGVIQAGDSLENLTHTPELICRNNYFGSCRARGILISTPKPVLVENNVFESAGSAILIPGDANYWYESGACKDVIIRGNHFSDCCMTSIYQFCEGIISICPEIPTPERGKPFHRNIRITDNCFQAFDYSVLYALSVRGLEFSGNKIVRSNTYIPFSARKHMLNLEFCSEVIVKDNILVGDVLGQDIGIAEMNLEDVRVEPQDTLPIQQEGFVLSLLDE